jgi:hypothetical protein
VIDLGEARTRRCIISVTLQTQSPPSGKHFELMVAGAELNLGPSGYEADYPPLFYQRPATLFKLQSAMVVIRKSGNRRRQYCRFASKLHDRPPSAKRDQHRISPIYVRYRTDRTSTRDTMMMSAAFAVDPWKSTKPTAPGY